MSLQVPKSATTIYRADDKRDPDISITAQLEASSATLRPPSIDYTPGDGDECYQGIANPSTALPTTPAPHSLRDRRREDSRICVSDTPATIDQKAVQAEILLIAPEHPSVDRGDGAMQSGEADNRVERGDRVVQPGGAPSTSFFQGASNVQITGSPNFCDIRGNATFIRFGGEHG